MGIYRMQPRFELGRVVATPGAMALGVDLTKFLFRHHCGDWGDELCADDKEVNEESLERGARILSMYRVPSGERIYIITEHDRSITTVMLREEY